MRTLRVVLALARAALMLASAQPLLAQSVPDAYFDFLIARHLEGVGDIEGAQASFEKAATEDPQSAEVRAELAAFHLRRDAFDAAEKVAQRSSCHRRLEFRGAPRAWHVVRGEIR